MDALDIARWQFGITTVYHFIFVPITIGMSMLVAGLQTAWVRTGKEQYLRATKFWGKLFLINFAMGVVTGIVQEFQFGMNWSDYSRFVGDIFGAPLAIEALLAFFLESTFLGLWIFGWDKIPKKLHLASIWLVHIGTLLSAYFILAANSWMQNPVGFRYNPDTQRAELTDFVAVLLNKVQLVTFPHVVAAAYMVGGAFVMAIALWHWRRKDVGEDASMYRTATRVGAWVTLVAALAVAVSGDVQGKIMTDVQPMKMAAAEALYTSADSHAPFSLFTVGSLDGSQERFAITVPSLLSFLATGHFDGSVQGIDELRQQYLEEFGTGPLEVAHADSYAPNIPLAYWTFRAMIGTGMLTAFIALVVLWVTRRGRGPGTRFGRAWFWVVVATPLLPIVANSFGWIFTETGRQPWLVFGLMTTASGVSPGVSAGEVLTSMIVFTLLYGVLAVVEVGLTLRYVRQGAVPVDPPPDPSDVDDDAPFVFAY